MKVNGQWVPCLRNSSYSFIPILLKLYRCCDHALKIYMWFGVGHFHNESEWAVGTLCAQLLLQFHANSFQTLHGLKICMWFGYNSWIIFCHFFHNLNLVIFSCILVNG